MKRIFVGFLCFAVVFAATVMVGADFFTVSEVSAVTTEQPKVTESKDINDNQNIISMLNMNCCYNDALNDNYSLAKCAAVSLSDFAKDVPGYGYCVNAQLVAGFVKSFYGVDIDVTLINEEAPEGYILIEPGCVGTFYHTEVSMTETENGYQVVTCLKTYCGGDDLTDCLVKSYFVRDDSSEFGFNLVYCEML